MVNLGDPAIMRSIMRAEGALCTLDCKQQIDRLICHLVWKETSFLGGRDPLFQSKWTDQSRLSPGASPASEEDGEGEGEKKLSVSLASLISFPESYIFSLLISFPLSLIFALLPKHLSVRLPSLSLSPSPVSLQHHPRCFPVVHL